MSCKCFSGLHFFFHFILLLLLCIFIFYILGFISIFIYIFEFIFIMLFLTLSYRNFSHFVKCAFCICVNFCLDWWLSDKESTYQWRRQTWVQSLLKDPLEKKMQPILVSLPWKPIDWEDTWCIITIIQELTWLRDYITTTKFFDLYKIIFVSWLR